MKRRRTDMQGQRSTEGDLYRQKARETRIPELRREYLRMARELDPYGEVLRKIRAEMSPSSNSGSVSEPSRLAQYFGVKQKKGLW